MSEAPPAPVLTISQDEFVARAKPFEVGDRYVLQGDEALTEAELRALYDELLARGKTFTLDARHIAETSSRGLRAAEIEGTSRGLIREATVWTADQKKQLRFCVDIGSFPNTRVYDVVLRAMARWESVVDIKFVPEQWLFGVGWCNEASAGSRTLFIIRGANSAEEADPANHCALADAFFPSWSACRSVSDAHCRRIRIFRDAYRAHRSFNWSTFNGDSGCSPTGGFDESKLYSTMLHELGHVLGFRHEHIRHPDAWSKSTCQETQTWVDISGQPGVDTNSIMFYDWCPGAGPRAGADLSPNDIAGARTIYGIPPCTGNCPEGCQPGTYRTAAGLCEPCPLGTASEAFNVTSCHPCGRGAAAGEAPGAQSCRLCEPGTYSNTETATRCTNCPPDTFASGVGNTSCTPCPAGQTSIGAAAFCYRPLGSASFRFATFVSGEPDVTGLAIGRLDDDDIADLASANSVTGRVRVFPGVAPDTFADPIELDAGGPTSALLARDVTGDGVTDLVAGRADGTLTVVFVREAGAWRRVDVGMPRQQPVVSIAPITGPTGFVAASGAQMIALRSAANGFELVQALQLPGRIVALATGDVDGDGVSEIAVAFERGVLVLRLNGTEIASAPLASTPRALVATADLGQIAVATDDHLVRIFDGRSSGELGLIEQHDLREPPLFVHVHGTDLAIGDFDGDGREDIAIAADYQGVQLLLGRAGRGFDRGPRLWGATGVSLPRLGRIASGDIDGNSVVDLIHDWRDGSPGIQLGVVLGSP